MNHIFIELLNNALIASALIVAVILVRLCIKKAPRWISCALWGLVALKLILPFHIESILSLVPSSEPIPVNIEYQAVPQITSGVPTVNQVVNPVLANNFAANVAYSVNPMQVVTCSLSTCVLMVLHVLEKTIVGVYSRHYLAHGEFQKRVSLMLNLSVI